MRFLTSIVTLATPLCVASVLLLSLSVIANTKPLADDQVASHGAQMIKKIPKDVINAPKAKRFSNAAKQEEAIAATRDVEEIRVIGERDPEDVTTAKRPPMLVFRERLENDKPLTPWQKTQIALCLIGLCSVSYGPEGIPVEDKSTTSAEKNKDKSSLQQSKQFIGTYQ